MTGKTENTLATIWIVVLSLAAILYFLAPILTPFVIGAVLAYFANPLVVRLTRWRVPRLLAVIAVFVAILFLLSLFVLWLIPLIQKQINTLVATIPAAIAIFQDTIIPWVSLHLGITPEMINVDAVKDMLMENWTKAGGIVNVVVRTAMHSGSALLHSVITLLLIPVVTFYLLCDWQRIMHGLKESLPRSAEKTILTLVRESNAVLSGFVRGQLFVIFILCVYYATGLSLLGLSLGLTIGIVTGVLSLIPYLGVIVGLIAASIAAYMQMGTLLDVCFVFGIFIAGHLFESLVLTPYFVGNRIGLHPVAVIFAILAGGSLFGFIGVFLALPVAAMLMVWIRYLYKRYRNSQFWKGIDG